MVEFAERIASFVAGRTFDDLERDPMLAFALVRAIELLGEAASKVSTATRSALPGIPWSNIIGMRHRLIHGYAEIDLEIVWITATEEVPALRREIERRVQLDER